MAVDDDLINAMTQLVPQLSNSAPIPTKTEVCEIVESPCTTLILARDGSDGRIVGMLTLAVFRILTGVRAWIEDVAVDKSERGQGIGESLSREALKSAADRGARTVELTSRSSREAANRLYQRLGFVARDTNVYRYTSGNDDRAG
jgi:ribosomal protein S18 acetylase RimI-like enzyme